MELIHRDDIPFEIVEELVKALQELHPGMKIVFAGDMSPEDMTEEVTAVSESIIKRQLEHIAEGYCFDCGKICPRPWPPEGDGTLPEGWVIYTEIESSKNPILTCPECDKE